MFPAVVVDPRWGRKLAVSSLLALGAFVVFASLPQRTFHGYDTDWYAALLQAHQLGHGAQHVAYLPLCAAVWALLRPLGFGAVDTMLVTSAAGSAVGVWFLHRAGLRLVTDRSAVWLPVAVAVTPACFYFATAAEVHGVFAAGMGAAWFAFARWRDEPLPPRAAVLGAVCALAASIHALGHLLSPMFVAIAAVQRVQPWRALAANAAAIAAAHAATAVALTWAAGTSAAAHGGASLGMLATWAGGADPALAGSVAWRECIAPYLPWSALAVAGLFVPRARGWSLAWLLAVTLHGPIAWAFLARDTDGFDERGAYLLPVAVPAVLAAGALLPTRWPWLALALSAVLAIGVTAPRWPPRWERAFTNAAAQLHAERRVAFLVGPDEIEGLRTCVPDAVAAELARSLGGYFGLRARDPSTPPLPVWFDAMLATLGFPARECVVTASARAWLDGSPLPEVQQLWRDHVLATYDLEPLPGVGLDAVVLRRR
jgi:hypothetical protein